MKVQFQAKFLTTPRSIEHQIGEYEAWAERFAIDPFWRWMCMSESVLWTSDLRRMLWVSAHDPAKPGDVAGYLAIAFDATMSALQTEYVRAVGLAPRFAVCLTYYVRAAYRRRGVGQALWNTCRTWLARYAREVDHVMMEPPAQVGRDVRRLGGYFKAPRNNEEQVLAFLPVRPDAALGAMGELLIDLEDCEDADIYAVAYGDAQ